MVELCFRRLPAAQAGKRRRKLNRHVSMAAAERAGRRLMIGMNLRFMDVTQAAYEAAVKRRALGCVLGRR